MSFIARDDESVGELIAWYPAEHDVEAPVQVSCAPGEVAVIVIDGEAAHELPAGRHQLTADSHEGLDAWLDGDDDAVEVAFLTVTPVEVEVHGEFSRQGHDASFNATATVKITDASAAIGLLENLGDDESLEDWLGDEVAAHVKAAIDSRAELGLVDVICGVHDPDLEAVALAAANGVLVSNGVTVQTLTLRGYEVSDETKARLAATARG